MNRKVTIHRSFEEADRSDREYYRGLSPIERLEILMELNRRWPVSENADPSQGLARVYRIVKRS